MSDLDTYVELTNPHMIDVFTNLFELKRQKKELDERIKQLEAEYKPSIEQANRDELYYVLPSGQKFNVKRSTRKGSLNTKRLEEYGIQLDEFRNKDSVVFTLRIE